MIQTDEEFREEALMFLNKNWEYFNENYPFDIRSQVFDYVRKSENFKYKDDVETDVIVTNLVDLGFIEFTKRENNIRYHKLTQRGLDFVAEKNSKKK